VFERKIFFSLKIYGKLAGLSNKFEPSVLVEESSRRRFARYVHVKNWNLLFYCSNIAKSENAMLWQYCCIALYKDAKFTAVDIRSITIVKKKRHCRRNYKAHQLTRYVFIRHLTFFSYPWSLREFYVSYIRIINFQIPVKRFITYNDKSPKCE
jgi:hypothetical protein